MRVALINIEILSGNYCVATQIYSINQQNMPGTDLIPKHVHVTIKVNTLKYKPNIYA
jgi:hypothetical protein